MAGHRAGLDLWPDACAASAPLSTAGHGAWRRCCGRPNIRLSSRLKPLASAVDASYEHPVESRAPNQEEASLVEPDARTPTRQACRSAGSHRLGLLVAVLLLLAGLVRVPAASAQQLPGEDELPIVITADSIVFDTEKRLTTAVGNAEVSRGERRLLADTIRYDENTGRVFAKGNIVLIEANGDAIYGDEMDITGDLKDGIVKGVRALLDEDIRVAGVKGRRVGGNTTVLEKAVYSPCKLCPDGRGGPIWQLRATRAVHDQEAKTLTYSNAVMEVFGVPVAYTPWFRHPDPSVRKATGFLLPSVGTDSELGQTLQLPFFVNLAPNRDITLSPLFTTDAGMVLFAEGRSLETFGRTIVSGSITNSEGSETSTTPTGEGVQGHLRGSGRYTIDEKHRAGFDGFWTSDKNYLRRYSISNANILENHAYLERFDDRDYYGLNAWAFQGLRANDNQDTIPVALPLADAHLVSDRMRWGSQYTLDSNVLALTRTGGRDVRRLSNEIGWEVPQVGEWGDLRRYRLSLRNDLYYTEGSVDDPDVGGDGHQTAARILPRATLDWSLPLVRGDGLWQHEITPLVSVNLAPTGLDNQDSIPNEDSIDFEFDETNLFLPIRFTGLDLNEGGSKIAYGFRFASVGPNLLSLSGVLGQSLRFDNDDTFPANSGLGGYLSHWVGRLEFRPSQLFEASYRFRVDAKSGEFPRTDVGVGIGPPRVRLSLRYVNLHAEPAANSDDDLPDREAAIAGIRVQMTDNLAVAAQTRQDLTADSTVTNSYGLVYSDDCLLIVAGIEKDFTTRGDVDQPTTFTLRIGLKTLGEFETGSSIFGL